MHSPAPTLLFLSTGNIHNPLSRSILHMYTNAPPPLFGKINHSKERPETLEQYEQGQSQERFDFPFTKETKSMIGKAAAMRAAVRRAVVSALWRRVRVTLLEPVRPFCHTSSTCAPCCVQKGMDCPPPAIYLRKFHLHQSAQIWCIYMTSQSTRMGSVSSVRIPELFARWYS